MSTPAAEQVQAYLRALQDRLCADFAALGSSPPFVRDHWERPGGAQGLSGTGITALLEDAPVFERGGVAFSDVRGERLPAAASARHPELAGRPFRAMGVSVVMHPRNPHAPTSHMNVRCFIAGDAWWFGGGFDLTPYIPYHEDVLAWHRAAQRACATVNAALYPRFRRQCDEYFFLRHRGEARGIGGIFYDDLNADSAEIGMPWEQCFGLMQAVGDGYGEAYSAIVRRRQAESYGERERRYQLQRRGRYVEFNLVYDRGTLFGLQSGGRTEAILMSLPPVVNWSYGSVDPGLDAGLLPYLTTRRGEEWLAG